MSLSSVFFVQIARSLIRSLVVALLLNWVQPMLAAAPPGEIAKLEIVIKSLGGLRDATFIRNGSSYDSKAAVKFLMNKLDRHRKQISSAADFIDEHASKSSTDVAYVIRFKDGHEIKCADYLKAQLLKIESPRGGGSSPSSP